jgi:ligand-binding sensor domain-containing protein
MGVTAQNWTIFQTWNSDLTNNVIWTLEPDGQGGVWMGFTLDYMDHFDGQDFTHYDSTGMQLLGQRIRTIRKQGSDSLWISYWGDHAATVWVNNTWTHFTPQDGFPTSSMRHMEVDHSGNVWFCAFNGGLHRWSAGTWTAFAPPNTIPNNDVHTIAFDAAGDAWIGTDGGVTHFDGNNWNTWTAGANGPPGNTVQAITHTANGDVWVGTTSGIGVFDGTDWVTYDMSSVGLGSNAVLALLEDSQGRVWVGTDWGGLSRLENGVWSHYNTLNSDLPGNVVECLAEDDLGNVWIGTNVGLVRVDAATTSMTELEEGVPRVTVLPDGIRIDIRSMAWVPEQAELSTVHGAMIRVDKLHGAVTVLPRQGLRSGVHLLYLRDRSGRATAVRIILP